MSVYTVHEPPPLAGEIAPDPERFVFVRDGFHFWAFALAPLWMLAHRLWLVLLAYLIVNAALAGGLMLLHVAPATRFAVMLALALLVGFEAGTLRRWTLRGWKNLGVVVGDDQESAERRFYSRWFERTLPASPTPSVAPAPLPVLRGPPQSSHVIGLFPEPGGSR
jgi:Protein of unknown function (DUF2628)